MDRSPDPTGTVRHSESLSVTPVRHSVCRTGRGSGKRAASQGRRRAAAGLTVPRMARWRERATAADSDSTRPRPGQAPRRRTAARRTAAWTAAASGGGRVRLGEPSGSDVKPSRAAPVLPPAGLHAARWLRRGLAAAGRWGVGGMRRALRAGGGLAVGSMDLGRCRICAAAVWMIGKVGSVLGASFHPCKDRAVLGIGWEVGEVEAARSHRA